MFFLLYKKYIIIWKTLKLFTIEIFVFPKWSLSPSNFFCIHCYTVFKLELLVKLKNVCFLCYRDNTLFRARVWSSGEGLCFWNVYNKQWLQERINKKLLPLNMLKGCKEIRLCVLNVLKYYYVNKFASSNP